MGIPDGARGKNTSSSKQSLTEKKILSEKSNDTHFILIYSYFKII